MKAQASSSLGRGNLPPTAPKSRFELQAYLDMDFFMTTCFMDKAPDASIGIPRSEDPGHQA
jgi:hypothetical protein